MMRHTAERGNSSCNGHHLSGHLHSAHRSRSAKSASHLNLHSLTFHTSFSLSTFWLSAFGANGRMRSCAYFLSIKNACDVQYCKYTVSQKRPPPYTFWVTLQKLIDFNNFWCTISRGNFVTKRRGGAFYETQRMRFANRHIIY